MKYWLGALMLVLACVGCQSKQPTDVVAKVGDYVITKEEFVESYKNSTYAAQDTPEMRKVFLGHMINQKLILLDAHAKGLDRDKEFLKMIEHFYQQSLITTDLQEKSKEGGNLDHWIDHLKEKTPIEIHQEVLQ